MPDSFSYVLLGGEALVCGHRTTTPKPPTRVSWAPLEEMTPDLAQEWFIQSIVPLVGDDAASSMARLLGAKGQDASDFLNKVIIFRDSLAGG
jgi:hypothetical protein